LLKTWGQSCLAGSGAGSAFAFVWRGNRKNKECRSDDDGDAAIHSQLFVFCAPPKPKTVEPKARERAFFASR
jgi:hypothetical protein